MATLEADLCEEALRLGFARVGIAAAQPADDFDRFQAWLDAGHAGAMDYMHRHAEARRHPRSILPTVRSVVMVALPYHPAPSHGSARLARYALGADYHQVLRTRLRQLGTWVSQRSPGAWGRSVVDTAPLLERGFARRAGLGWFGKNTMLIHPRLGSFFLLAGLLLDIDLEPTPSFDTRHCGTCTACLDACPTQAFPSPGVLDARRCISYLTIELKSSIPEESRTSLDDWVFGCDICQEVCPWNRKARPGDPALAPRDDLVALDAIELLGLSALAFKARFQGTALFPRPGRPAVLRNAALVLGNTGDLSAQPVLHRALNDEEPLIREAAGWAIRQIKSRHGE
ncbi:MAG: tRNA epoxyqueuosine(34) reductase QueG [Gemmataceae bacterium]